MIKNAYEDYKALGLCVIPIEWDVEKKLAVSHRYWSDTKELPLLKKHNALMIKTDGDVAAIDFDLKNTERKSIFKEWQDIILYNRPDIWDKIYIEETRNKGYHVWIKYKKLEKKLSLADSDQGSEVIALYAKGPLVYTFPTPGYTEISGSMADIDYLTDDQYEYLISTSQLFNEYKPDYNPELKAVSYPAGHEAMLSQFDKLLPDEYWEQILADVGLTKIINYRYHAKDKFAAFKRAGSDSSAISAKVYYHTKRVMIFSASLHKFPNWHNKHDYPVWSLPPSFVLFYHINRDWAGTIEYISSIIESAGIDIKAESEITTDYPLHVFPDEIRRSIIEVSEARSLAPQFVATAGLWTISSLAGTMFKSEFNGDGKNILFCLMIAPVSVGKTPAFKVMCETPLKEAQENMDETYIKKITEWQKAKDEDSKKFKEKRPVRYIPIAVDGTTEGYIAKSMVQPNGIGVYQDEAETILNAGSFKSNNDAISFFTQAFSGGRISQIRADDTKERVVPNLNLNLLMGTQPTRVKNIFTEDRLSSGFASRFLMVSADYKELNIESDPFSPGKEMCQQWKDIVTELYYSGMHFNEAGGQRSISITDKAKETYRTYYKTLLQDANSRISSQAESYIIGTEAKMSAYFPRLIQILAIMHDPKSPIITEDTVHHGWTLYRYYATSTINIISKLHGEIETGLPNDLELLYQSLPDEFTRKEAVDVCVRINEKDRRFDVAMRRKDFSSLFRKEGQGKYRKV